MTYNRKLIICDDPPPLSMDNIWNDKGIIPDMDGCHRGWNGGSRRPIIDFL